MALYQLTPIEGVVLRTEDSAFIPNDPANGDRQDYDKWIADGNTPDPVVLAPPEILKSKRDAGIIITSTGTPSISGTYGLDDTTLNQIGKVANDSFNMGLPGNLSTFTYPDITGTNPKTLSAVNVQNLYKAMRDLMFGLETQYSILLRGGTPTWPSQSVTIP